MAELRKWAADKTGRPAEIGAKSLTWLAPAQREWLTKSDDFDRGGNPPSWVVDEATWERAKKAVEKHWDEYDEPYAVVASVYRNMGGETK